MAETTHNKLHSESDKEEKHGKPVNVVEQQAKEQVQKEKDHPHDEETHGTSDDIDESTSIEEVKGPGVFQRAKEEVEALVDAVLPNKD
ncbi:hypothetical protein LINPERPRIM_LOCUS1256 [Linum perenne]